MPRIVRVMARGAALYLVGSLVLVALAACGRSWFEEREPWRHEAEVACLRSGAVRQGPAVAPMQPIAGPGACGADFPLRVAALGDGSALGFADDPRPPASVPPGWSSGPSYATPLPPPDAPAAAPPGAPLSVMPPGIDSPSGAPSSYEPEPSAAAPLVPSRGMPVAGGAAAVTPPATLACPLVAALDDWIVGAVQPAAQRWFGQPVAELKQISAYACRGMNGQRGAPISEHAFGNAIDVAAFTLADGRKVTVENGWRGLPEERGFLRDIHAAACRQFMTVLAPGSDAFHYDHIHLDLARRASGRRVCSPHAVPGNVAAAPRGDPPFTGALGRRAVPGAD